MHHLSKESGEMELTFAYPGYPGSILVLDVETANSW